MTGEGRPETHVWVRRRARIPDPVRLARYRQAPELGPRLLFFSGGNALRKLSRHLVEFTHNSVHLVTPFDSGGSSAELRRTFDMPAVGDLRNRLMALADQTVRGNPEIYTLFGFRFPADGAPEELRARLDDMASGSDPLVVDVPEPLQRIVRSHLTCFTKLAPETFDLRGAAVGNLVLAGGYLSHGRNLDAVLYLFSQLVEARGTVRPVVDCHLDLVAELRDGRRLVGQHRITGRTEPPLDVPVDRVFLSRPGTKPAPHRPRVDSGVEDLVEEADLVCFPIGSFYSSLVATLLPEGVADSIARSGATKIYVPNPAGTDPEELGLDLAAKVRRLVGCLKEGASTEVADGDLLEHVLVDAAADEVPRAIRDQIRAQGADVVRVPLVSSATAPLYDHRLLAEALLSLV